LSNKEIGHITLTLFNKLYGHYKDNFDLEMMLKNSNMTYAEAYKKTQEAEEWF